MTLFYIHTCMHTCMYMYSTCTYCLEVILELLEAIVARDVWCDNLQLVHVSRQEEGGPTPHSTPPTQQERAAGRGEDAVESSNVIENFVEENNIQLLILSTCIRSDVVVIKAVREGRREGG